MTVFTSRPNHPADASPFILPSPLPRPSRKEKIVPIPETPERKSAKRPLPVELEDGVLDLAPTPKKPKVNGHGATSNGKRKFEDAPSPSKRRRLEADGLVEMDGPDEVLDSGFVAAPDALDSDIIIIDDD